MLTIGGLVAILIDGQAINIDYNIFEKYLNPQLEKKQTENHEF